ncbi:MAG: DUF2027 domain-containing protein [Sphingobacteriaceae bacterium]|nr:DUF2027 domain-containing protein [Sphingobacteriaceae bacterium]
MKLRIGDKVRFLNEKGEGIVSRIKDNTTVFVEMSDGFEIPYLASQLVAIHTELIVDKNTDNIELIPDANIADAIYFVVEPDHEMPLLRNEYNLYLYNASAFYMLYTYSIKDDEYYQALKNGNVGPYQKILLKQVKIQFFKDFQQHTIEAVLFKNSHYRRQVPISESIYIEAKSLSTSDTIKHSEFKFPVYAFLLKDEFLNTQTVEAILNEEDIKRLRTIKEFKTKEKVSRSHKEHLKSLEKEVDLHIEELLDSTKGLGSHEMLSVQLEHFEKELDEAILKGMKKIVFIHGVGNGRLKQEIIAVLRTIKGVTYQDGSYKDYGFGATQVNIGK